MCVADFFNKVAGSRTATLLKIDFNTGEIFESFKNTLFYRTSLVAASDSFIFSACNFVKKETAVKMFFCEFCEIFKNIFSYDGTPPDDCFFRLSVNFEKLFRTLVL